MAGPVAKVEVVELHKDAFDTFPTRWWEWVKRDAPDQLMRGALETALPAVLAQLQVVTQQVAALAAGQGQAFVANQERPPTGEAAMQAPSDRLRLLEERLDQLERSLGNEGPAPGA